MMGGVGRGVGYVLYPLFVRVSTSSVWAEAAGVVVRAVYSIRAVV